IKDMDQKELEKELPRLREEAVKAEKALRVAQERLHEADPRLAKIPTFVEVHDDHLVVDRRGRDKMVKLLGRLTIPLDHVVRAEADPNIEWAVWRGWRVPGVRVPGVRFYDMHGHRDKTIVIWLKDETYDRLITEVQDPAEVVKKINEAVEARSSSSRS
ncbi:MAG TPA: hypothetical protein VHF70_03030, partial [Rubrobacteraceae bacterium]|nr:hypothetical protein [Rubrobacteraceae bacterium]